jgi:hypothetical protein
LEDTAVVKAVAPGAGVPTGSVTFTAVNTADGSTVQGSALLVLVKGNARATFKTSALPAGTYTVTAVYGGDPNFLAAPPAQLTQTVKTRGGALGRSGGARAGFESGLDALFPTLGPQGTDQLFTAGWTSRPSVALGEG